MPQSENDIGAYRCGYTKPTGARVRILWLYFMLLSALSMYGLPAKSIQLVEKPVGHSSVAPIWKKVYARIPAVWKTGQKLDVREVSGREMARIVEQTRGDDADRDQNGDTVVDGCYQNRRGSEDDTARIFLSDALRGEEVALVFAHEYGHFVWDELLNDRQRDSYYLLWREQKKAEHLVTEYAAESEEEGFAEAFSYFLRKPDTLQKRDPASTKFLRSLQNDLR